MNKSALNFPSSLATKLMFWKIWKMRSRRNFFRIWSGRWESNPRPKLGKLLYCHCTTPARFPSVVIIHNEATARTDRPFPLFSKPTLGANAHIHCQMVRVCLWKLSHKGRAVAVASASRPKARKSIPISERTPESHRQKPAVNSKIPRHWKNWWARQDLNLGPTDYESAALTAELRARAFPT